MSNKINHSRNYIIDAYRGITIISMVLYHACFDYFISFGRNTDWLKSQATFLWQQSICISFIIVSGMVWPLGKKRAIKRSIILLIMGFIITIVTMIITPETAIHYGILTFIGLATLFMIPIDRMINQNTSSSNSLLKSDDNTKIGKNIPVPAESFVDSNSSNIKNAVGIIICLILFMITKHFPNGYIGTRRHAFINLPMSMYKYVALIPFGFPTPDFVSGDYFPLIPWIFMYILGYFLGRVLFTNDRFNRIGEIRIPILSFLGTKSLLIYALHQPVCYGIMWLLFH